MKMRVVGGPRDGQWVNLKEGVDMIKLVDPYQPISVEDLERLVQPVTQYTTYTVRRMIWRTGPKDIEEFRYLAPEDWSDFQALKWQFEK